MEHAAWSGITFFGESVKGVFDKETNETYFVEVPRLPIKAYYPWNAFSGIGWLGAFIFQVKIPEKYSIQNLQRIFVTTFKR